jgi:hypothetical protein
MTWEDSRKSVTLKVIFNKKFKFRYWSKNYNEIKYFVSNYK